MIDADVKLGEGVKIFDAKLVNIFGCTIGARTFIGPFVEITRGVAVGADCKIESHAFVCDGVTLENGVFVGHGVVFTNDLYPRFDRQVQRLKTVVEEGASLGSNATIIGGIRIGRYSVVGAGAVVTKDVPDYAIVAGNPAKTIKQFASENEIRSFAHSRQPSADPHRKPKISS